MASAAKDPDHEASNQDLVPLARHWLDSLFAPWVKALELEVQSVGSGAAVLCLPFNAQLCREGGTLCGQALMAAADTAMVLAISSLAGEFKPTTTVSQNMSFLRPVAHGGVTVIARVIKPGRNLMFGDIELVGADGKQVGHATTTYAML